MDGSPSSREPIGQRLPRYLGTFGLGLAAAGLIGLVVWLATSARLVDALGYSYSALGAVLLLVGGMRGSGYGSPAARGNDSPANALGRAGDGPSAGRQTGWPAGAGGYDPVARRRRRLQSAADPAAFWQVMAGCAYFGLGLLLTLLFAAD